MSEQGEKPEVLPGDLITRPGLYESRSQGVVEVRHWGRDGWVAQWGDKERIYFSDGTRTGLYPMPDPYQLLHWVGPLLENMPERVTTTEQLAEIEEQAEQPPQPEPVQVREGRWRTRGGDIRNVTPTPEGDGREHSFPWWDAQYRQTWTSDGRYHSNCEESPRDLVEYLGPLEQQPRPVPQPPMLQDADERIRLLKQTNDAQAETIERLQTEARDLNMEIGGLERQLLQRDARIRDLETMHAAATQAVVDAGKANDKLRNLANNLRQQFEAAANEISEQRSYLDKYDKQLDQKDAQIRDLRIELEAAQQVPQPVSDEERERIWDEATEQAGRQVVRWLRPLADALSKQPDERFCRFMALTLSVLPDLLPELLGYAVEDESLDSDEDRE